MHWQLAECKCNVYLPSHTLQIAFAIDVGKYVEEILLYMSYTVKIDPSGALLCVQQVCTYICMYRKLGPSPPPPKNLDSDEIWGGDMPQSLMHK